MTIIPTQVDTGQVDASGNKIYETMDLEAGALPVSTVDVRIVNGKYVPCVSCHWFSVCVVPLGSALLNINKDAIRRVFKCIDFTSKTSVV